MDSRTGLIHRKMAKVEGLLYELNSEIYTASNYLAILRNSMNSLVKSLNTKTEQAEYLEEYIKINTFVMKSLGFVSEFNCKFELLNIFDKSGNNFIPDNEVFSSVLMSQILDKSEDQLRLESVKNGSEVTEAIPVEEPIDEDCQIEVGQVKGKDVENCQEINCESLCSDRSSIEGEKTKTSTRKEIVSDCGEENSTRCLRIKEKNSEKTLVIVKNNSHSKAKSVNTNNAPESFPSVILDCLNNKPSQLSTSESSSQVAKKKDKDTSIEDMANLLLSNQINSSSSDLGAGFYHNKDYSVPEYVITKVKDWWTNSEVASVVDIEQSAADDDKSSKCEPKRELDCEDIKPLCLSNKFDKEYEVTIEHIVSPSEFYIILLDSYQDLFQELERKLKLIPPSQSTSLINNTGKRKTALSKEIGRYALVYLKCEEIWCRARIVNWFLHLNNDFVSVFLLDYGESKCVSVNDLQPMPVGLKKYPAFSVRCHLHGVYPVDTNLDSEKLTWGKEALEHFCTLIESSNKLKIKIAAADGHEVPEKTDSVPVSLFLIDSENTCVNDLLIKNNFAVNPSGFEASEKSENTNDHAEKDELKNWNPMKEDFESYNNSYDFDINDPAAIIYGYVGKDYERVCKHFARDGICYKNNTCKKEHGKLDPSGFTTDQEEIYKNAFNTLRVPPLNSIVNVQVTCVLACNKFFCFLENKNSLIVEEDLHSLLKLINNVENVKRMKKLLVPPSAGQIVIAQFSEDNAWYRARVIESQPEEDKYVVGFVDYGNKETHPLFNLRAIEARYLHLPFQAMECTISGIDRNPQIPVKKVMDYLKGRMDDGHISIKLISKLPGENINLLVHVFDKDGRNIGDDMVAENYAVLKEEILINTASGSVPG